jgi:D-sedoheptulose 7-phosphate isomerase
MAPADLFRRIAADLAVVAEGPYPAAVEAAVDLLSRTFAQGGKVLLFGNGGSASDAQHIAAELVGRFAVHRRPLAAIALGTNHALVTAWSNDTSYDDVFARELEALGQPGDVAWGISTSGNSRNVIAGLERARACGLTTLGLTGESGGAMAPLCDVLMAAPAAETARIQEIHVITYHAICAALEARVLPGTPAAATPRPGYSSKS